MKRTIAVCVCALLGLAAGYFVAPVASVAYVQSREPDMFGAFIFYLADNFAFCLCENEPPSKILATVSESLSDMREWRAKNSNSRLLRQEIGLIEAQRSRLEQKLGQTIQAEQDMKDAQRELAALGWKDVSADHLTKVTTQLTAEYRLANQSSKAAAESH